MYSVLFPWSLQCLHSTPCPSPPPTTTAKSPSQCCQPIYHHQPMQLMPVAARPSPSYFLPSSFEFINRRRAALHELARLIGHPEHLLATFASLPKFQVHHIDINAIFDSSTMDDDTLDHLLVVAANPDTVSHIAQVGMTHWTS